MPSERARTTPDEDERYWIDDPPPDLAPKHDDGELWLGVIDEAEGGIVAYFGTVERAEEYIRAPAMRDALEALTDRLYREYPEGFPGWLSGYIVTARAALAPKGGGK